MREEIRKILEMLQEGRITVEEAERLIAAIESRIEDEQSEKDSYTDFHFHKSSGGEDFSRSVEDFAKGIVTSVFEVLSKSLFFIPGLSSAFKEAVGDMKQEEGFDELVGEGFIVIRSMGDDIRLRSGDVNVEPGVYYGSDFTVPHSARVYVSSMGGDISAQGRFDRIVLKTFGGDIEFSGRFDDLQAKTFGGDIRVRTPVDNMRVKVRAFGGSVKVPQGYNAMERGGVYVYGSGEGRLLVADTFGGDFILEDETFG